MPHIDREISPTAAERQRPKYKYASFKCRQLYRRHQSKRISVDTVLWEQNPQSQLKLLVTRGKEQGYSTYAEVNDHLPNRPSTSDQRHGYSGNGRSA